MRQFLRSVADRSPLQSVAVAVLSVGLALGLTMLFQPVLSAAIFALFYLAAMFSALYGGMVPGVVACVLSIFVCRVVFLNAQSLSEPATLVWLLLTFGIALIISGLSAALRHVQRRAKAHLRQLQASEERYRRIVDTANEGIWSINADLQTVYVNQRLADMLGYATTEMLGRSILEFMDAEAQQQANLHLAQQQQGKCARYDLRFRRKDGSDLWAIVSVTPILNAQQFVGALAMLVDISDRKAAEADRLRLAEQQQQAVQALQVSEARFRRLVEANIFGVAIGDFSGRMIYANDALLDLLGYSRAELESGQMRWDALTPDEYLPLDSQAIDELRQRGVATPFEKAYIRKDGSRVPLLIGGALLNEPDQPQETVIAFYLDLTAVKRTEQRLKLYADIVENVQVGLIVWQLTHWQDFRSFRLIAANLAASQMSGTAMDQFLGKTITESFPGLLETNLPQGFYEVVRTGVAQDFGSVPFYADRIAGIFAVKAFPLPDQCVGVAFENITARKRMEEALRDALQRLTVHFETSPLAVIERDRNLQITRWSRAAERIFGWQAAEVLGKGVHEFNFIHPEDAEAVLELRQRLFTGEDKQNVSCNRSHTKDGAIVYCEWYNSAVFDEAGNIISILSLVLDVTERQRAEQEREQLLAREQAARAAAEAANRSKDEFLAVLSHELRSPLNPILGWSRLLQTRSFDAKSTQRALETIERNARIQAQLIEDLLDVSRIIRGKLSLTIAPVSLISVVEAALETVRLSAEAKSIDLAFDILDEAAEDTETMKQRSDSPSAAAPSAAAPLTIAGDASRLQQIVWNLLSNAVKFTPAGGRVEVQLEQSRHDDYSANSDGPARFVQLTVRDTGRGISPEFLPHVFDYFRQADSTTTRTFGGLGLGLAIVRHLAELHGGTVEAASPGVGQGATFTVKLPLLRTSAEPRSEVTQTPEMAIEPANPQDAAPPLPSQALANLRVLIVDDEPDMREFLSFTLEEYGAIVFVVSSSAEALTALSAVQPDLLITDIGMPAVDGYTLIQQVRLRSADQGGEIPAIALTAYASETDVQRALASGFQRHVAKPVDAAALVAAIVALMPQADLP